MRKVGNKICFIVYCYERFDDDDDLITFVFLLLLLGKLLLFWKGFGFSV